MRNVVLIVGLAGMCGCTNNEPQIELHPVTGTVKWQNKILPGAAVTFTPIGDTHGAGGFGRTDANGVYKLTNVRGPEGVAEGEFKVVISKRLLPDGSDVPENDMTPPIDSPARESLPPNYSDAEHTTLTAKVSKGGPPLDFDLK